MKSYINQAPHCDVRVLHAPGECQYCDRYGLWQALRQLWGIAFTGHEPNNTELPDPATNARGLKSINSWAGNTPEGYPEVADWDKDRGDGFNSRGYTAGLGIYHDPMG